MPPSKGKESNRGNSEVSISLAYVAFLHDQLAVNQSKLREILGSGANVISGYSSDQLAKTLTRESPFRRADRITKMVKNWGMDISQTRKGNAIQFVVSCPYASYVHPRMTSDEPICPLGEYVLGEVRQTDRGAALENNALVENGSRFSIRLDPEWSQDRSESRKAERRRSRRGRTSKK
jgi:hypothetical protein